MQTRETINSYWVLNLWEAIDSETLATKNVSDNYAALDIGKESHRKIISKELLRPHLATFSTEDQQKISLSMQYVMKAFSEQQLLDLLNSFGVPVFPTSSTKITTREFYMNIYHKLFTSAISLSINDYTDLADKLNFRNLELTSAVVKR